MKVYRQSLALLELQRGKTYAAMAETLDVCHQTVSIWAANYWVRGVLCLQECPRSR
jgi:hypothetical protein